MYKSCSFWSRYFRADKFKDEKEEKEHKMEKKSINGENLL
jgi:hypothetical protein